jgi:threonine synthase
MRFVSTRAQRQAEGGPLESCGGRALSVSLQTALFDGLAPDGGLYVPESIEPWGRDEIAALPSRSLVELGVRVLRPFTAGEIAEPMLATLVADALSFPIPLVDVEPGVQALELFHGPTLAFKDIGARLMARLMAALGVDHTILVATSGDTGSAVAHAFHGVPRTRVVVLYPDQRVSPTQEAQLTMFNPPEDRGNVRAYAISGSFDDCQRLVKEAFTDPELRAQVHLTSANSINIGRLLPQMVYYFHAVAQLGPGAEPMVATPSGNFGNLTAGLMAKRAGLPVARFVAATNVNDVVPAYLETGRYEPRHSVQTIATAMDVGSPSNFERMQWLYGDADAMRRDIVGCRFDDVTVRETIRRVYGERGYLLDPHGAIGYLGLTRQRAGLRAGSAAGVFLATAHPAKFPEEVEAIIGRSIPMPAALAEALARPRRILRLDPTLAALRQELRG